MITYLLQAFIYLAAAAIAVTLAKRLGLGSVLGYLIAGVLIGPAFGLVGKETAELQHVAEFGVVMMLFLVGLELEPRMLWNMRGRLLGLGGLQVLLTMLLFAGLGMVFALPWQHALAVGMILALSSTAIVLQTFNERGLGGTPGGRSAFSVLLFQDIAVIPMLALLPLLAMQSGGAAPAAHGDGHAEFDLISGLSGWAYALVLVAAIAAVVLVGHFLSRPLFRVVAATGLREAFTAAALALVIGVALLMNLVGLSPALGTFLAGVVLANSEFRHELESDIEPFKGLLLGLFFITVGAGIDFSLLLEKAGTVLSLTLGVMVLKALVLFGLALFFRLRRSDGWLFALSLAQAGEFGFVLLSFSVQNQVIPGELSALLALVVGLSMFLTPLLFIAFDRLVLPRYQVEDSPPEEPVIEDRAPVIIAGIGRFGQVVNRLLTANGVPTVVLDRDPVQIENMRRVGFKSFYGDATRGSLLEAAGIEQAELFVVAIDQPEQAVLLVHELKRRCPGLRVLARAFDRGHHYRLRDAGADYVIHETHNSALELGTEALRYCGIGPARARAMQETFEELEREGHETLYAAWLDTSEGERSVHNYGDLYMKLNAQMREKMSEVAEHESAAKKPGADPAG